MAKNPATISVARDYVAEVRDLIDQRTPDSNYVRAEVAQEVVRELTERDPELLIGFLQAHAVKIVAELIKQRDASIRAYAAAKRPTSVFAAQVKKFEAGDLEALEEWLDVPISVQGNVVRRLADLTPDDVRYAAERYRARADANTKMAKFLEEIGREVQFGRVSDYFDNRKLSQMWTNIT